MSRSGYSEDCDLDNPFYLIWPSIVRRSIQGKRGQSFLQELAREMDAMLIKELITGDLVTPEGTCCTIGVICKSRGIDITSIDIWDSRQVGDAVCISMAMAAEIEYENDDVGPSEETPAERWIRMRKWVEKSLNKETARSAE